MMSFLLTNFPLLKIGHFLVQVNTECEIFKKENKESAFHYSMKVWNRHPNAKIEICYLEF